ncbi:MAG TPA: glycosyltransferase [Terriglobales bacterium]|nr:glycosyltransferase [Terriglobales bacterium]
MDRLKVLVVTNWYPTKQYPARAVWVRELAKAAAIYDHVRVLHCAGPAPDLSGAWKIEQENHEVIREGIPVYRVWYRPPRIQKMTYLIYLRSMLRAFRHVGQEGFRPDVIHVHVYDAGGPAVLFGRLNHIPVVVSEHFSSFLRRALGRLDIFKAWLAFRGANLVLPVSRALQRAIEDYGIHARSQVIPNTADTTLFSPALTRNGANTKRLLFVGQLTEARGVSYLLRAVSHLHQKRDDWQLDIVGDGDAKPEYERLAADLRLCDKVAFHGLKTRTEVAEFMRRAQLLVLSSLCETFSAPAIEALASGIPVLATRCGGPEEFITRDVGLLVPPADEDSLYQGLDYMLTNLHLYSSQKISQYAAERFSPEVVGAKLHAIYQSLNSGPPTLTC